MPGASGTFGNFQKGVIYHLVEIEVLSPVRDMEWGLPTFITPKKMAQYLRLVSDLRELNGVVKKTQYTLPIITDVLRKKKKVMNS